MNLKKEIIDKVIQPHMIKSYDTVYSLITKYDPLNNIASIEFTDAKSQGTVSLDNVPLQLGSGGVHSSGPFVGDYVWVSFANNSPLQPKIVALADEQYARVTRERLKHTEEGAFIPESISNRNSYDSEPIINTEEIKPMVNDWFDYNNKSNTTYSSFSKSNPLDELSNNSSKIGYYEMEEPGITHPSTSSTIKLRNNGCIDIFVGVNEGIRIDPKNKTINTICTSEKHHVSSFNIYADTIIDLQSNKDINLSSKGNINMTSAKWTLNVSDDINISSKSNINIESSQDIKLKSKRIILDGDIIANRNELIEILNG